MNNEELNQLFYNIDFNHDGELNYSEFLAATVNKEKAVSDNNLKLAFHHFDVDNSGFITDENLVEAFRREGKKISIEEAQAFILEAGGSDKNKLDETSFRALMKEVSEGNKDGQQIQH